MHAARRPGNLTQNCSRRGWYRLAVSRSGRHRKSEGVDDVLHLRLTNECDSIEERNVSWRTNAVILSLRNLGRATGLNRLLSSALQRGYEDRFQATLLASVRPGDTVRDVGANQGLYSQRFSEAAGASGQVFALCPSCPQCEQRGCFFDTATPSKRA